MNRDGSDAFRTLTKRKGKPMNRTLKAALLATTMSAVALVPAATVITFATVDTAHAKGGNGNGNGGGNGNSSASRGGGKDMASRGGGGGKPSWAGQGGKGNGNKAAARGGPDPVGDFLRKLTGQEKKAARQASRTAPTKSAPVKSVSPAKRPERNEIYATMHPSELGNMNGALNANMNAILAHVRNGNTNGPVGHMAALAVAAVGAEGAAETLEMEGAQAYLDVRTAVDDALAEAGFDSLEDYAADKGFDSVQEFLDSGATEDPVLGAIGTYDGGDFDLETYEDVAEASDALDALTDSQKAMLSYWNKNPDTSDEIDPETEQPLLDALMGRFEGQTDAILEAQAAGETLEDDGESEDLTSCDDTEGCDAASGEEELASAD